jgi:hypothetical protein
MSLTSQIIALTTRIGQEIKGKEPKITTKNTAFNVNFGSAAGTACQGNDSRLSDARTPASHSHGSLNNAGQIGSTSGLPIKTGTNGALQAGAFGTAAGTFCQGDDSRLANVRTPADTSVTYAKVAAALKQKGTVTSTVDLSANGIGAITLSANTAFSFSGFELNKSYMLVITANGFTPSWSAAAKHIAVEGNAAFATSGVFYVVLTCIDATSGSEKLLTSIMKGA